MKFSSGVFLGCMMLLACSGVQTREQDPLQGKVWQLISLDGVQMKADDVATLEFASDGRLTGKGFCNRYMARYQIIDKQLKISQIASTKMACMPPERMQLQGHFLSILQAVTAYQLMPDGKLQIVGAANKQLIAKPVK